MKQTLFASLTAAVYSSAVRLLIIELMSGLFFEFRHFQFKMPVKRSITYPIWMLIAIISSVPVVFGCSDPKTPTGPERLNKAGFPLTTGNRWTYRLTATTDVHVSDSLFSTRAWQAQVFWQVEAREVLLGQQAARMSTTFRFSSEPDSGKVVTGETWFAMRGDTLQGIASRGVGAFNPASAQLFKPVGPRPDTPIPWGVNVLLYPLAVGKKWAFGPKLFGLDEKVVEGIDSVSVPAGQFEAFRVVRRVQESVAQIRTEQWMTAEGLVKMKDEVRSVQDLLDEQGNLIRAQGVIVHSTALMVLESYSLK